MGKIDTIGNRFFTTFGRNLKPMQKNIAGIENFNEIQPLLYYILM